MAVRIRTTRVPFDVCPGNQVKLVADVEIGLLRTTIGATEQSFYFNQRDTIHIYDISALGCQ